MTDDSLHPTRRLSFLGLIAWVSLCLIVAGWFPQLGSTLSEVWVCVGLLGLVSAVGLAQSVKTEILVQQQVLSEYISEARTDPLTSLANRRAFDLEIRRLFALWQRQRTVFSLLLIDVDDFKRFNDTYGHQAGDEMLRAVSRILEQTLREMDFIARFGGEEFAVVLPATALDEASMTGERARAAIAENTFAYRGAELNVRVSVGAAEVMPTDDPDSLVSRADVSLYAAKEGGRNCLYFHDGESNRRFDADAENHSKQLVSV